MTIQIQETTSNKPNGIILASGTMLKSTIQSQTWVRVDLLYPVFLTAGVLYAIVAKFLTGSRSVGWDGRDGGYANGTNWYSTDQGATWTEANVVVSYWPYSVPIDFFFEERGFLHTTPGIDPKPSPFGGPGARGRIRKWPFGLHTQGYGMGDFGIPELTLPQPRTYPR